LLLRLRMRRRTSRPVARERKTKDSVVALAMIGSWSSRMGTKTVYRGYVLGACLNILPD
jgi:hypothetical protein